MSEKLRTAAQAALEALEKGVAVSISDWLYAEKALRAALAESQPELSSAGTENVKQPEPALPTMGEQIIAVISGLWAEHPDYSIRQTLDALNAMFPVPQPEPLTDEQADELWRAAWREDSYRHGSFDWYLKGLRDAEKAHGIGKP